VASRRVQCFNRKRLADTLVQALEAIVCTFGLMWLFAIANQPGAIWALVSAVIVLRPGFEDSLHASKVRIAANVVGALVGVSVGTIAGSARAPQIALALALVILICLWPPLEQGVRSACAGVVIVMMHEGSGSFRHMGLERLAAVLIGCLAALLVGYVGNNLGRRLLPRDWR
jgi:uncharacterized membrane protein YgaE (UPF0421/DUF939 family)